MAENSPVQTLQKTTRIWSSAREREIAVKVYYDMQVQNNCTIYHLGQIEEIE